MNTLVFSAYWPECRMKFYFSLIWQMKFKAEKKNPTWPTLAQGTFVPQRHVHETHHIELRAQQSQPSPHGQGTLTAPMGYKVSSSSALLPNPYLALDKEVRISRKGKWTVSKACCMRVGLLWLRSKRSLCPDSDKRNGDSRKDTQKEGEPPQGGRVDRTGMGV